MTDHQDHNTEPAPTAAAAELAEPTTELPAATHAAPELAWSVDDTDDVDSEPQDTDDDVDSEPQHTDDRHTLPRPVMAALVVLVGTAGAAVIALGATYFQEVTAKPPAPTPNPYANFTPTYITAPPPPPIAPPCVPAAVAFTPCAATPPAQAPAPPTVTSTPGLSAYDLNFLSLMSQEGWGCTDNSDAEQCRKQMVSFAHQICSYSGQPIDLIYQNFGLPSFLGPREERRAIANAEQAYPNCTFTGSP